METLVDRRKLGVTDGSGEEKGNGGSETVYDAVVASPGCLAFGSREWISVEGQGSGKLRLECRNATLNI